MCQWCNVDINIVYESILGSTQCACTEKQTIKINKTTIRQENTLFCGKFHMEFYLVQNKALESTISITRTL